MGKINPNSTSTPNMGSTNEQIGSIVERFIENEDLTDALDDDGAKQVLSWGKQNLLSLKGLSLSRNEIEATAQKMRQIIQKINRLNAGRKGKSDEEFVRCLLELLDLVRSL